MKEDWLEIRERLVSSRFTILDGNFDELFRHIFPARKYR